MYLWSLYFFEGRSVHSQCWINTINIDIYTVYNLFYKATLSKKTKLILIVKIFEYYSGYALIYFFIQH